MFNPLIQINPVFFRISTTLERKKERKKERKNIIIKSHRHDRFPWFSHNPSLSASGPDWSSKLYQVSVYSWGKQVLVGRLAQVCPCVGVYRRTLLMSSTLLLHQCPIYLVRLDLMVCEMGDKRPNSYQKETKEKAYTKKKRKKADIKDNKQTNKRTKL